MLKRIILMLTLGVAVVAIVGCNQNNFDEKTKQSKAVTKEESEVISQTEAGDYLIQIRTNSYQVVEDDTSPYDGLYHGNFTIAVRKNEEICDSCDISFDGEKDLYFPEEFQLSLQDYNGDGMDDFALGQRVSSSAMEYQFYTVDDNGKVKRLNVNQQTEGSIITDGEEGYDATFHLELAKHCA